MTTFEQVIARTRRRLMTTQREGLNVLATAVDASETGFSFDHALSFVEHSKLSVDLEDLYVMAVSAGGASATVLRGQYGSVAASHAVGAIVHINPTWTNWDIAQAVNDELVALSSPVNGLFRIQSTELNYQPVQAGYDLAATDLLDIWRISYDHPGPETDWPIIPRGDWRFDQNANPTDFPSGRALIIYGGGYPGHKIRVAYKATFDTLSAMADDVEAVSGLHAEAHDILSIGAALRLLSGVEGQRSYMTTQPDPRRAEDIPPRTALSALVPWVEQREERINEEQTRLSQRYPGVI